MESSVAEPVEAIGSWQTTNVIFNEYILEREAKAALDGKLPGSGLVREVAFRAGWCGVTFIVDLSVIVCDEVVH